MSLSQAELQDLLGDRYRLRRELGGGSMAAVYLAEDTRHGRQVAIKLLRPEYGGTIAAERFLREIEIAARLQHPHIVPLLDSGQVREDLYLVMPYIEGESLRARLARSGPLPVADVIRILIDVTDALVYAHAKGVIHRDIKPDNILLSGRHALVTDFGVAKAVTAASVGAADLTAGAALGTPAYMAPEQVNASPDLDHRVDLYALGTMGYEMLGGRTPFNGPTAQAVLAAQLLDDPVPVDRLRPDLPAGLGPIVMRLLAKEPEQRWATAEELLRALEPLARPSGDATPAGVASVERAGRWWWAVAIGTVLLAVLWLRPFRSASLPEGVPQRPVTFSGLVASSALSPDGRSVAFATESAGIARVVVQDLAGGPGITIASGRHFSLVSWSGDGGAVRMFSIGSTATSLWEVPRLGGSARVISAAGWSTLSPDGTRLATVAPSSSAPARLPVVIRDLATGDSLFARTDTGYWQSPPAWSPDGSRITWAVENQDTRRVRVLVSATKKLEPVIAFEDSVAIGTPVWDGNDGLLFLRNEGAAADLYSLALSKTGTGASSPRLIQAGLLAGSSRAQTAFYAPVSVSSAGPVLYTRRQSWSNIELATFESFRRGEPPHRLTNGNGDYLAARLAQDGHYLALVKTDLAGTSLEILPLDGSGPRAVSQMPRWYGLGWSPSGERVAAVVEDPDSGVGLRIFQLDQAGSRSYLYGRVGDSPEWIDDSTLVIPGPDNHGLQLVELARGRARMLPGLDTAGSMLWERADAGGKRLAFVWNRKYSRASGVFVYRLTDSTVSHLVDGAYIPVRWSADGRSVYLVSTQYYSDTTRVVSFPVNGGSPHLLGVFPPELRVEDVFPDGEGAVLIRREIRADAWLIDRRHRP
jgi:protein kinase-like protein/WD40 repeat protein